MNTSHIVINGDNQMHHKISFIFALLLSYPIHAEEIKRSTMTSCAYQAGTAREIQTIRQAEGDDWTKFEKKVKKIYKDGQGRTDLLAIAKMVYLQPTETSTSDVYEKTFSACVKLTEGTADSA